MKSGLIAKIHVAKKQLALTDENYRDILRRHTGKESCSQMDAGELDAVLGYFKKIGFVPKKTSRKAGNRKLAQSPQARMIRGMWIELHQFGAVKDPSEAALASYVERMSGVSDLQWITPPDADKVIKGLRAWLRREEEKIHGSS